MAEKDAFHRCPLGRTPKMPEGTLAMIGPVMHCLNGSPIVECWSGNIIHVGPVGAGHKMKLIMNFIAMSYISIFEIDFGREIRAFAAR